jgi:hypothetical protein
MSLAVGCFILKYSFDLTTGKSFYIGAYVRVLLWGVKMSEDSILF